MIWGIGKDTLDNPLSQLACSLILFLNDTYQHPGFDIRAILSVHFDIWMTS
jgi:hypothetical protein